MYDTVRPCENRTRYGWCLGKVTSGRVERSKKWGIGLDPDAPVLLALRYERGTRRQQARTLHAPNDL